MNNNFLNNLALEYLKAKYDINSLSIDEYYKKYYNIYTELAKIEHEKSNKIATDSVNTWLKINDKPC
ncbi:hypothetical protein [Clostridium tyrobutyricum]|uniref:hypothetical protein n=1 Tax=Clostridium tyrobutyricum TaxID=1519 RepID=UPI00057C85A6|nr:hypothetical protein [Clostridium tyrobutyricum]